MKLVLALAALVLTTAACTSQPTAMNTKPDWKVMPSRIPATSPLPPFVPEQAIVYSCKATLERAASAGNNRFELKYEAAFELFTKNKDGLRTLNAGDESLQWKVVSGDEKAQPVNGNTKNQSISLYFKKDGKSFIPVLTVSASEASEDGTKEISGYTEVRGQAKKGSVLSGNLIVEERNNWSKGEPTGLGFNSTSLDVTCTRTE